MSRRGRESTGPRIVGLYDPNAAIEKVPRQAASEPQKMIYKPRFPTRPNSCVSGAAFSAINGALRKLAQPHGVSTVVGETTFLVLKAQFQSGNDIFTLYVNPVPGSREPAHGVVK